MHVTARPCAPLHLLPSSLHLTLHARVASAGSTWSYGAGGVAVLRTGLRLVIKTTNSVGMFALTPSRRAPRPYSRFPQAGGREGLADAPAPGRPGLAKGSPHTPLPGEDQPCHLHRITLRTHGLTIEGPESARLVEAGWTDGQYTSLTWSLKDRAQLL